ncbi:AMP-binding protein [Acidisphaera sp. L21]|uniref:AMP-binding protein n=1 Tax=Acidisphaera sp. L21 TaxID=1641851 RepID=UPI00131D2B6F|nr:AMP-binding protein [Acidisphaera sp. L21]
MNLASMCPLTTDDALRRAIAVAPEVEAIVASDGRLSYAQLGAAVAKTRAALTAAGVEHGDHVGLCLGNGANWIVLFLALGSIGAVTVPMNTRFRAEEMAYALRQSRVTMLFVADRFLKVDFIAMLREICPEIDTTLPGGALPDLRRLVVLGDDVPPGAIGMGDFMAQATGPADAACTPDDVLLIQYTSGTTSFPKGVMLTHTNMLANAYFSGGRIGFRVADRYHSARPFFHVAGSTLSVLSALQHVVTLITMDRFEADEALRLLEEERCTHFSGNDTMALMLLNHPSRSDRRFFLRGAWAAASPTVMRRIIDELGAKECVAGYGLSEASPNIAQSCWWEPEETRTASRMRLQPGVEVIIQAEDGTPCPAGTPGEIVVRGWNVMRGYFDKPKETAEALTPDGWLSTGDLGRLGDDGRLEFLGRVKDIVRVGGENVSPAEIENLLHRHPAIRQAAVVGVPDPRLMEVVAAFVIPNEGFVCDPGAIMAWCKDHIAGFKVPRHVWVVEDFESIGMTASSKVQKKPLAAHARKLMGLAG